MLLPSKIFINHYTKKFHIIYSFYFSIIDIDIYQVMIKIYISRLKNHIRCFSIIYLKFIS